MSTSTSTSRHTTEKAPAKKHRQRHKPQIIWTPEQLAVVSVLIKEKKQLRDAVRRCEETENRVERIKNEPIARKRVASLKREIDRDGIQPHHLQELRELLDDFPEHEAALLKQKLREYETRRLLQLNTTWVDKNRFQHAAYESLYVCCRTQRSGDTTPGSSAGPSY
ncbi:hypothetical protein C8Q73DRAFT_221921 [Cubamyces lactineus]|nr:hypothetical protein C8Q73DRAFT_221921 [Cubamyces lactineus]